MSEKSTSVVLAYRDEDQSGQPFVVTGNGHRAIFKYAADGVAQADIANRLGMSLSSFRAVLDRDEDAKAAFDGGRGEMETELVSLLMQQARDGNLTATIFALKALAGKREVGPAPDAPAQATPSINITIPPALSAADLQALTATMRTVDPDGHPTDEAAPAKRTKGLIR
ncbi:MAG: hypothetical protein AAFR98_06340 [Pseudomonadota bacterium]